ncbi:polysaccharide biosynthesis protein [Tolypothrix sp. NIES-4075]|uniref:lipopolysaccharide biosynthesis protein n=1 Tax=Tolypothrix sp. NIES-4075 TaxID=2005459 RepID=UPI000B5CB438|nr:oligosaccharide flippase family protein [Tolypothrix sp. NIES-4075]GAX39155.1 polysaccharide biosynthesis protein [Tolypothrix sp. NIES-4075]
MKNSLLKNGFYNTVGGAIKIGLAVLTIPILIRMLGIEEYGLWTLAYAVVQVVNLAEAGLSVATTVFVSQDIVKENADDLSNSLSETLTVTFGGMLIFATIAAISLLFGAELIVSFFPKLGQVQQLTIQHALQIGGLVVWARLLQRVLIGVEQAYQRYDLANLFNTIESLLLSFGMLIVTWLGGRTIALMQWQAVAAIAILLSHVWVFRTLTRNMKLHVNWNEKRGLAIARYSVMTWLSSLGGMIFARGDRLIVGALLGSKVLGVYATITDLTTVINRLSDLPVQPLLPALSKMITIRDKDKNKLQQQIKQAVEINTLVALGLGTAFFTLAPFLMHVMLGDVVTSEYILALRIEIIIETLYSLYAVGYYVLFSVNAVVESLVIHLFSSLLSILLIFIYSNRLGLIGSVIGNTGFLCVLSIIFLGMKYLNINTNTWLQWYSLPLYYFIAFAIFGFIIKDNIELILCLCIVQIIMLIKWFIDSQSKEDNAIIKYFNYKKLSKSLFHKKKY